MVVVVGGNVLHHVKGSWIVRAGNVWREHVRGNCPDPRHGCIDKYTHHPMTTPLSSHFLPDGTPKIDAERNIFPGIANRCEMTKFKCSTAQVNQNTYEWPSVTSSDSAKYSVTRSIARLLCDSWASCTTNWIYDIKTFVVDVIFTTLHVSHNYITPAKCRNSSNNREFSRILYWLNNSIWIEQGRLRRYVVILYIKQEAQLSQRSRAMLHATEYFTQDHSRSLEIAPLDRLHYEFLYWRSHAHVYSFIK